MGRFGLKRLAWIAGAALLPYAMPAFSAGPEHAYSQATDRLIVRLKGGAPATTKSASDREAIATRLGALLGEPMRAHRVMGDGAQVMQLSRRLAIEDIARLGRFLGDDPDVIEVLPDRVFFPAVTPNDPSFASQWALDSGSGVNAASAWNVTTGAANLVVAIVDTGKLGHAELASRWIGGYDFVADPNRSNDGDGRDANATDPGDWVTLAEATGGPLAGCPVTNSRWHGTAMAGVIGATANNAAGIAGLNWSSKLLPVRVVGKCGAYEADIADGIRWAAGIAIPGVPANANVADLVNVSLSTPGTCSSALQSAINEVLATGTPLVVAAGNNSAAASGYSPGNCAGVITVGAVDRRGGLPPYANTGSAVTLSAPGGIGATSSEAVLTTFDSGTTVAANDSAYSAVNGTSVATAHVTGVASLMLSIRPTLKPAIVGSLLANTARDFPADAVSQGSANNCTSALCGKGIVDAAAAVGAVQRFNQSYTDVAAGSGMSYALRSDGKVYAWGNGSQGALGDGTTGFRSTPALATIDDVVALSAGSSHVLALRMDGSVWAWGTGGSGTLGDGFASNRNLPVLSLVPGFSIAVAGGASHSLALRSDGIVWAWGSNANGQLGDGSTTQRNSPVPVSTLSGAIAIAAGGSHSLALKSDGTVWAWGANASGQLGDGTTTPRLIPTQVAGLTGITAIDAGSLHSLALKGDGTVWAWGTNFAGELGDGSNATRVTPGQVPGLVGIVAISAGSSHNLALKADGTVWAWGQNASGQLGDATTVNRFSPAQIAGLASVARIQAGGGHSVVLRNDGGLHSWGGNGSGELGNGTNTSQSLPGAVFAVGGSSNGTLNVDLASQLFTPQVNVPLGTVVISNTVVVSGIANGSAIAVSGGDYRIDSGSFVNTSGTISNGQSLAARHTAAATCATTTVTTLTIAGVARTFSATTTPCDFTPAAFAFTTQGGLAPGTIVTSNTATVAGIDNGAPISVSGGTYSIGCTATFTSSAGTINNNQTVCVRQTASASANTSSTLTLTIGTFSTTFTALTAAAAGFTATPRIASGGSHLVALRSDGSVWGWGSNTFGELGDGTTTARNTPVQALAIGGVVALAAGSSSTRALRSDGTVWSWGGVTGDGTTTARPVAIQVPGLAGMAGIAVSAHTVAVKGDGTVFAWGDNIAGQVGDGSTILRTSPVLVGITGVHSASAGSLHTLARKNDGTVWAWGSNANGRLGDGTNTQRLTPVQAAIAGVTAVAAGSGHSLALKGDGSVWAWGDNTYGQVGDGSTTSRFSPVAVAGLANVVAIAAGGNHSLALKGDGTVWAWGYNAQGQLGDSTGAFTRLVPTQVAGLAGVTAISAGQSQSMALRTDGSVVAWGANGSGELGSGTNTSRSYPDVVLGPGGIGTLNVDLANQSFTSRANIVPGTTLTSNTVVVSGVAAGSSISVTGGAYRIDGGAFVTTPGTIGSGQSLTAQLTAGACGSTTVATITIAGASRTFTVTTIPCDFTPNAFTFTTQGNLAPGALAVSNTVTITGIDAGAPISVSGGQYSLGCSGGFTSAPGTVGNNMMVCVQVVAPGSYDSAATATVTVGTFSTTFSVFTAMTPGFTAIPRIAAGSYFNMALRSDGVLLGWGANNGALGIEDTSTAYAPAPASVIGGVTEVTAGNAHVLAVRYNGQLWSWGTNGSGQLGDGTTTGRWTPLPIAGLTGITAASAGADHSLALASDGSVRAWGANVYGQLGDGTATQRLTPVTVSGLAGVTRISAGAEHSLAVKGDGTAWTWGANTYGQLGDGTTSLRATPVQVSSLAGVSAVGGGRYHSLALKGDGTVWAWGRNDSGQLGDATTTQRLAPVQPTGLAGVVAVAAGSSHSLALKSDGTVWAWGANGSGQLGDGTTVNRSTPVQVIGLANVIAIDAGESHSIAMKADGGVYAWGANFLGQLGEDSSIAQRLFSGAVRGVGGLGTLNLDLSASSFTMQTGVPISSTRISNTITITGIPNASPISVTNGLYSTAGLEAMTDQPGTINPGQAVTAAQVSAAACGTTKITTVFIAGTPYPFSVTTIACDRTPQDFAFTTRAGITPGSAVTSNTVTIAGIDNGTPVSVQGGQYSIGCTATFTSAASTIDNNQTVCVRQNASGAFDTSTTATLTVGTESRTFAVISAPAPGFTTAARISARFESVSAVRGDGTVWSWGATFLSNSTVDRRGTPLQVAGISGAVQVATGDGHFLALRSDGTLWGWGRNLAGQVGDGTYVFRAVPVQVAVAGTFTQVAAGSNFSLALRSDGTVWTWGADIGGAVANHPVPIQVAGLSGVVAIAAQGQALALLGDGTVHAWSASYPYPSTPTLVAGLTGVTAIAAGAGHSLALRTDGTVAAWGTNTFGQVGDGTTSTRATPVTVAGLGGVVAIAAGGSHSMARKGDGSVVAWGNNQSGQLGDGTFVSRLLPVTVSNLPVVAVLDAGREFSAALKPDGTIVAWGRDYEGQLGDGGADARPVPALVLGPQGAGVFSLAIAGTRPDPFSFVSAFGVATSSLIVSNPVTISGLGAGVNASLTVAGGDYSKNGGAFASSATTVANGDTVRVRVTSAASPASLAAVTATVGGNTGEASTFFAYTRRGAAAASVPQASLGASFSTLLTTTGNVLAFGYGGNGQLGTGTTLSSSLPTASSGVASVAQVSAGANHVLALKSDGTLSAWGYDGAGQLGVGMTQPFRTSAVNIAGLSFVSATAAGANHSLALKADGTVWAWGLNADGQAGPGQASVPTPVQVPGLSSIVAISAGGSHNLALSSTGTVFSWGGNATGQLGDGTSVNRTTPVALSITNVVAIAACGNFSLAIRGDGSLWAWGANAQGQLGNGGLVPSSVPVAVSGMGTGVGLVACGEAHALAVKAGGLLYAWGNNANSQLGDGLNTNRSAPYALSSPASVVAIAAGARHSAAIDATGKVYVWGDNFFGQVGNRSGNYSPHAASLNVLRGDTVISEAVGASGSGVGTGSNSGTSVLEIDGQASAFDFGAISAGNAKVSSGKYSNQSAVDDIDGISLAVTGGGFNLQSHNCPGTLHPGEECSFTIGFNPGGAATYSGEFTVASSVVGSPERRSLSGTGVATAAIALSRTEVGFPPQTVGTTSANAGATLTNTGNATLVVSGVTSSLGDFAPAHGCASVPPGGSCVVSASFTPTTANARTAYLTVTSNAADTPHVLTFSGTGVATAGASYALSVTKAGAGGGTVTSSPAGISCGDTCTGSFSSGAGVTLTASASAGSTFAGWSGAGCSGSGSCQLTLTAPANVSAVFNPSAPNLPSAPQSLAATAGNGLAVFTFAPPASDGGSPVTSYSVSCNGGAASASATGSPITVAGLANGVAYSCLAMAANANGMGAASSIVGVTPSAGIGLAMVAAQSRKAHGATTFNLPIDTTQAIGGTITVEPRSEAIHHVVFVFNGPVTVPGAASAKDAANSDVGSASASAMGNTVQVALSGVPDNARVSISLSNVNNAGVAASVALAFLVGDTSGSRSVTAADVLRMKGRAGLAANSASYLYDLDLSGAVSPADLDAVKLRAGLSIP